MKPAILYTLLIGIVALTGCAREETPYIGYPGADVSYTYWTGPSGTIIEGEVFNDGETYLEAVELEVELLDHKGRLLERDWFWVNTYSYPGEQSLFTFDLSMPYVDQVVVNVTDFRQ